MKFSKVVHFRNWDCLAFLNSACTTKPPSCADHFVGGQAPIITSPSLAKKTTALCFEGYAVTFSGISRTPVWSAEHLTAQRVHEAGQLKRKNTFHVEEQLPAADRSELADYVRSGFDRGHMAPNGDMPTENAQHESFSLANMIPQNPKNNQILWEGIEEATREFAREDNNVYVVTGRSSRATIWSASMAECWCRPRVYKAIYDPAKKQAARM